MRNSEEQQYRRLALAIWIEAKGGVNRICREYNFNNGFQSQLKAVLRGYSLGNRLARKLEILLEMPENWLDSMEAANDICAGTDSDLGLKDRASMLSTIASGLNLEKKTINISHYSLNFLKVKHKKLISDLNFQKICDSEEKGFITDMRVTTKWLSTFVQNFTNIENLRIVTAFESSQFPRLNAGDPVLIDVGVKLVNSSAIYLYKSNDYYGIKKIEITEDKFVIFIKNDSTEPLIVPRGSNFMILGKVVKYWSSMELN